MLTTSVPRVRRIMEVDDELPGCTTAAAFLIAISTEMFIQYLTERSFEMARSERKPRKNIQYQDVGKPAQHPSPGTPS
jgi:DNA polymerase epsilon subunit 4